MGSSSNYNSDSTKTETVGSLLRRERLSKRISLEDVAEATCVNIKTLRAIEGDDYNRLPARVFVQGFIRLYAKHIGLDPDEILAKYPATPDDTPSTRKKINVRKILESESMAESPSLLNSKYILFLVLLALLAWLIYIGRQSYFPANEIVSENTTTQTTEVEQAEKPPEPVEEPASVAPVEEELATEKVHEVIEETPKGTEKAPEVVEEAKVAPAKTAQQYVLKARFTERTWVWIRVDENKPQEYLFRPGQKFSWTAHDKIDINLGNAGGVNLVLNDRPIPAIGVSGQVVRLTMPDATQTLLEQ